MSSRFRWALAWGVSLCVAGIAAAILLAPGPEAGLAMKVAPPAGWVNPSEASALYGRYLRLANWDSAHFYDIARNGYRLPEGTIRADDVRDYRANVTFLPSYPLVVGLFSRVFGISSQLSLLLVAQLFGVAFWTLLLVWLEARGVARRRAVQVAWVLFAYPSSFYLVAGYTESLYLAALLALICLSDRAVVRGEAGSALGATISGILMTGSRLVGFPAIIYPTVRAWLGREGRWLWSLAISLLAAGGTAGFFLYCQLHFGHWDLYFRLLEAGWGQRNSTLLFLFDPRSYVPYFFFEDTQVSLNRAAVPLALGFLAWGARAEWRRGDRRGPALRLTGLALLYLAMAGKAASNMDGMIRYTLPVITLALMAGARNETSPGAKFPRWAKAVGLALFAASQAYCLRRFLLGHWVS